MSKLATPFFFIVLILSGAAYLAQPELPVNDCVVKNEKLAKICMSYIPKFYDAGHLTFKGHTTAWAYRWIDKLGIGLSDKQTQALVKYSSFEDAVNCYYTAAGDASLNMTLTPTEFETRFEAMQGEQPAE